MTDYSSQIAHFPDSKIQTLTESSKRCAVKLLSLILFVNLILFWSAIIQFILSQGLQFKLEFRRVIHGIRSLSFVFEFVR